MMVKALAENSAAQAFIIRRRKSKLEEAD